MQQFNFLVLVALMALPVGLLVSRFLKGLLFEIFGIQRPGLEDKDQRQNADMKLHTVTVTEPASQPPEPNVPAPKPPLTEEAQKLREELKAEHQRQQRAMDVQRERDQNRQPKHPPIRLDELEADLLARWTDWQLTRHIVPPEPNTSQHAADQAAFMATYLKTAHPDVWTLRFSSRPQVRAVTRNGTLLPTKPAP